MKENFTHYAWRGLIVLAVVTGLYFGGYFLCVRRSVYSAAPEQTPNETRTLKVVVWLNLSDWKYRLFAPAWKLDSNTVRRRYWSSWYVVATATSTNLEYECDRKRR
jgi:hypothetical protein